MKVFLVLIVVMTVAIFTFMVLNGCGSFFQEDPWEKDEKEAEIIEIVGNALNTTEYFGNKEFNGDVGVYPFIKRIVFWDMAKKEDIKAINSKINALLDYLKLEYVIEQEPQKPFVRKKKK